MATVENISIDSNANSVVLREITIQDSELVSYLSDFDQSEQEEAIKRALRIGASAMELVGTSKEAEVVENRFGEMEREFEDELDELRDELDDRFSEDGGEVPRILEQHFGDDGHLKEHLNDIFGSDGQFAERLQDELGEDGEKIQEALDPDREGTPTNRLQKRIVEEIEEMKQRFDQQEGKEEGKDEIRQKTTLKGFDFEDQVEEMLSELVHQTPNQFEDTSEQTGELGTSKKGDFVISLNDTNQRIVVEAKGGTFNSTVDEEMTEAIENRDADYGILVVSSVEYIPRTKFGWFSETDQDYLVVALSEQGEEEIESRFFKFAFHWARTRTMLSAVDVGDDLDPEIIKGELDGIEDAIDNFSNIRSKCTNLERTVGDIRGTLEEIEDDVTLRIGRLEKEIGNSS